MSHWYDSTSSHSARLLMGTLLLLLVGTVQAQDLTNPRQKQILPGAYLQQFEGMTPSAEAQARMTAAIEANRALKLSLTEAERKVSALLRTYAKQAAAPAAGPARLAASAPTGHPLLLIHADGSVQVTIRVTSTGAAVSALQAAGAGITSTDAVRGVISARVQPAQLEALAELDIVRRIDPVVQGLTNRGSVVTEGDAALRADVVRRKLGRKGQATRICVISDGITSAAEAAATRDLPKQGRGAKIDLCPTDALNLNNQGDEGTAMLEIVHDIAPLAKLGFCPAFGPDGEAGLARSITWLANDAFNGKGCDVIVDDVAYLTEPYFEDGIVAQAVDAAAEQGVLYFSSAGNSATNHYEQPYVDSFPGVDGFFPADLHDFGVAAGEPSDQDWLGIVAGAGNFFAVFMQWNEPFGGAASDYDVYLFDQNGFPAGSPGGDFPIGGNGISAQDGDDDPLEVAFIVNTFGAGPFDVILPFFIVVDRFAGDPDRLLEMNFNGLFALDPIYNVAEGSVWGHAAAKGAVAVAAIDVNDPGQDTIEPFSSRGPSRIFFPAVEERAKPDLTAFDGVSVTGAGGFPSPFFGTSAAAPHAAAVAGLLLSGAKKYGRGPGTGAEARANRPALIVELMQETAVDLGDPGFDFTFGAGRLDALAAARALNGDTGPMAGLYAVGPDLTAAEAPQRFGLRDNYPNPFNPTTTIAFDVAEQTIVRVEIFDLLGRKVQTLVERDLTPGAYTVQWNGKDAAGRYLPSGTYLYRMQAGDYAEARRMTLLK